MAIATISVARIGSVPEMTIFVGQAQYGEYTIRLKKPGRVRETLKLGDNADDVVDTFLLVQNIQDLDQAVLSWWITIAAPAESDGQLYFARISLRQDGNDISGGTREYSGELHNTENIIDAVRIQLV